MKIYTKTGDEGTTGLFGGRRILKDDARIEAYGTVDELNCFIGSLYALFQHDMTNVVLQSVQNRLFDIGSHLASDPDKNPLPSGIDNEDILMLERVMDEMNENLEPLRNFILPGGSFEVAAAHICRTVCRRAERRIVTLKQYATLEPLVIQYMNRLSDFFFILARFIAHQQNVQELKWVPKNSL